MERDIQLRAGPIKEPIRHSWVLCSVSISQCPFLSLRMHRGPLWDFSQEAEPMRTLHSDMEANCAGPHPDDSALSAPSFPSLPSSPFVVSFHALFLVLSSPYFFLVNNQKHVYFHRHPLFLPPFLFHYEIPWNQVTRGLVPTICAQKSTFNTSMWGLEGWLSSQKCMLLLQWIWAHSSEP